MKGSGCLIHWGFYRVKSKQDTVPVIQGVFFYYIHRLYCKETGRTISLLPDFLHPRKRHTQQYVQTVFARILGTGKSLKGTAKELQTHFQTIQKWLSNFADNRHQKSVCFASYASDYNWHGLSSPDYCAHFWGILERGFSRGGASPLSAGTRLLWEGFGCPLY
jgi:hypothetical protein